MAKLTYGEQLKHPNWQRKRLEVLRWSDFSCCNCGDKDSTLHVHHKRYVKGRLAWEYPDDELEALCESCHAQRHEYLDLFERIVCSGGASVDQAIGLLAGYLHCGMELGDDVEADARMVGGPAFVAGQFAALLERFEWSFVGRLLSQAFEEKQLHTNPSEKSALEFLSSFKDSRASE